MPTNIVETIQSNMGLPPLQKVDPNIQEPAKNESDPQVADKLPQAALPAVLAGLYKFTRTDDGGNYVLAGGRLKPWIDAIFGDKKQGAVEKVAHYAGVSTEEAAEKMEEIAQEAILVIHQTMDNKHTAEKLKVYMNGQRHNILVHLPAAMQLGDLLEDNSMDDRTNKMEGPISNLMHKIENALSKSDESKYP